MWVSKYFFRVFPEKRRSSFCAVQPINVFFVQKLTKFLSFYEKKVIFSLAGSFCHSDFRLKFAHLHITAFICGSLFLFPMSGNCIIEKIVGLTEKSNGI